MEEEQKLAKVHSENGSKDIKAISKQLPNKSKAEIKEKLDALENQPVRKKVVIRNQAKKTQPKSQKEPKPKK